MGSEIPTANIQIPERPESGAEDRGRERGGVDLDGKGLLDELEGVMRRFVVLPKWGAGALALWVVHTYAFELREGSTYVEEERPTLLIDEADTWLQGNDQLRGILNSGYSRKTAYVVRVAREKCRVPG